MQFLTSTSFLLPTLLSLLPGVSAAASPGCGAKTFQPVNSDKNYTLVVGALTRAYTVFVPPRYSTSSTTGNPLILSFHGNTKTKEQQEQLSQMSNPQFNTDHIVVYPQGYQNHWEPAPYANHSASDLDFIAKLLPTLQLEFCIDTTRIYAAGKSLGGGMTNYLACDPHLGPQFAAFAPVSGAFYYDNAQNHTACKPGTRVNKARQTPMLEFHGLNDTIIPYTGGADTHDGGTVPDIETWAQWWAGRNGCSTIPKPNVTSLYDGHVKHIVYTGCGIEHYSVNPLGHSWPSTKPNLDNPQGTFFNATPIIMDWFRGHTL